MFWVRAKWQQHSFISAVTGREYTQTTMLQMVDLLETQNSQYLLRNMYCQCSAHMTSESIKNDVYLHRSIDSQQSQRKMEINFIIFDTLGVSCVKWYQKPHYLLITNTITIKEKNHKKRISQYCFTVREYEEWSKMI